MVCGLQSCAGSCDVGISSRSFVFDFVNWAHRWPGAKISVVRPRNGRDAGARPRATGAGGVRIAHPGPRRPPGHFEDERFARPDRVERDAATGELTVLAEFITGSRLSDLLDATADASIVPGVDVALGYLLESLPALTLLHSSRLTHGLIDASRTVLTPDGQFVFLDPSFGSAVERLNLPRLRLWHRFGVASPAGDGAVHFDAAADIAQVALGGVAIILGRNLRLDEYPDALPSLLMEVIEVAQIRGSSAFATGLQRFLQRALPIPGRRPYASADEAVNDARQLVRREIGVDVCRQAVIDFAAQMDGELSGDATDNESSHNGLSAHRDAAAHSPRVPELDEFLESFESPSQADADVASPAADTLDDEAIETGLSLDSLETESDVEHHDREPSGARHDREPLGERHDREPLGERGNEDEIYDLPPLDQVMADENILAAAPTPSSSSPPWIRRRSTSLKKQSSRTSPIR